MLLSTLKHTKIKMLKQVFTLGSLLALLACSTPDEAPQSGPKNAEGVDVFYVNYSSIQNDIQISGSLLPNEEIDIRSEVAGRIDQLNFSEGSNIAKGKLILKIDLKLTHYFNLANLSFSTTDCRIQQWWST